MKIFADLIPSGQPHRCSSAYKIKALMEKVLLEQKRSDVFFYVLIPEWIDEAGREWLLKHPNVEYLPYPYLKDRMREYLMFDHQLDELLAFNGTHWDYDLLITSRTSTIPFARAVGNSPRNPKKGRLYKKIACIEEMMILESRATVAKSDLPAQEMMTLTGYHASDVVFIQTQKERKEINEAARQYFSPSRVREIDAKLSMVAPVAFRHTERKDEKFRYERGVRPMCVGYTSRLEKGAANLENLFSVLTTQYALNPEHALRFVITSVTTTAPISPPEFVDVRNPNREEFWRMMREEVDVCLSLHKNSEFSLSRTEPMMLGVPTIMLDLPWARSIYGEGYPFYAPSEAAAYAMLNDFQQDYATHYAKFAEWQQKVFEPMFQKGSVFGLDLYDELVRMIDQHVSFMQDGECAKAMGARTDNSIFAALLDRTKGKEEFVLFDLVREAGEAGDLEMLDQKTRPGDRDIRRLVFSTAWNELRTLFYLTGWEDASPVVGHMRRSVPVKVG